MAGCNSDTITIVQTDFKEGRRKLELHELLIDGQKRGACRENVDGTTDIYFYQAGHIQSHEAKAWIQGMLQLVLISDRIESNYAKTKKD